MNIDPKYLDMSFEGVGVRNSQKRLKSLIADLAVEPLNQFQDELTGKFELVEDLLLKRIAAVVAFWCRNKYHPVSPRAHDMMSTITNSSKNDIALSEFYFNEVKNAMFVLAPNFALDVSEQYSPDRLDELEFALLELEETHYETGALAADEDEDFQAEIEVENDDEDMMEYDEPDFDAVQLEEDDYSVIDMNNINIDGDFAALTQLVEDERPKERERTAQPQRAIAAAAPQQAIEVAQPAEIQLDVLNVSTEHAWRLVYDLMGYDSEYIQNSMIPRWQNSPDTFDKDRRFMYGLFIDTIRNAAGTQHIAGNYTFGDRRMTVDQLWTHYFSDLSQRVGPQLAAARIYTAANDPWYKKLWQRFNTNFENVSIVWMIALAIALIFDGLTTYISLDQTPMEGIIVPIFTILITALFQIADQLVISYRRREFDAEAMAAKYHAQFERLTRSLETLQTTSESFVQLSMDKSKAHSDWKAAEDNRKMARRGRFWSARIADINVVITAYGFSYLFLNGVEPMYALAQQIDYIFVKGTWESIDLWVFLMIGLAVTVSFVVNTAQRTEILGWSMRRMKKQM